MDKKARKVTFWDEQCEAKARQKRPREQGEPQEEGNGQASSVHAESAAPSAPSTSSSSLLPAVKRRTIEKKLGDDGEPSRRVSLDFFLGQSTADFVRSLRASSMASVSGDWTVLYRDIFKPIVDDAARSENPYVVEYSFCRDLMHIIHIGKLPGELIISVYHYVFALVGKQEGESSLRLHELIKQFDRIFAENLSLREAQGAYEKFVQKQREERMVIPRSFQEALENFCLEYFAAHKGKTAQILTSELVWLFFRHHEATAQLGRRSDSSTVNKFNEFLLDHFRKCASAIETDARLEEEGEKGPKLTGRSFPS